MASSSPVYSNTGWRLPAVGGSFYNSAANCGLFFFNGSYDSSDAYLSIGARLLYIRARLLVCMLHFFAQILPHRLVEILPLQDGL